MIELTRTHEVHSDWRVKILGIGGAGTHAVDRLNRDGLSGVDLLVANTDARALGTAYTSERISLGQSLTRGLGAGGDPELGRAAALESIAAVGERLAGASLVVLLVGLGGGTGSGAAPSIARVARAQGAHVAVFATLPFSFEGRRRREQAMEALDALQQESDLVICFENDRMSTVADPANGIEDAFQAVDSLLAQAVRALAAMTRRRNVLHSGLDEIAAVVAGPRCTALFGYGAADGEERARAAVARAFSNPLLHFEGAVASIASLWVYVAGGPDMRLSELQSLMEEAAARLPREVRLYFGAAVDPQMQGAVSVTLLAGVPSSAAQVVGPAPQAPVFVAAPALSQPQPFPEAPVPARAVPEPEPEPVPLPVPIPVFSSEPEPEPFFEPTPAPQPTQNWLPEPEPAPVSVRGVPTPPFELSKERRKEIPAVEPVRQPVVPAAEAAFSAPVPAPEPSWETALPLEVEVPGAVPPPQEPAPAPERQQERQQERQATQEPHPEVVVRKTKENVQEQMRFEPVNRGRFEKTDPTIVDGEDLDIPTFLRQGVSLDS